MVERSQVAPRQKWLEDLICEDIRFASEIGFNTSLITNGSRLSADLLGKIAPHMSWLGLSLDSANDQANREIDRVDQRGGLLNLSVLPTNIECRRTRSFFGYAIFRRTLCRPL